MLHEIYEIHMLKKRAMVLMKIKMNFTRGNKDVVLQEK